MIILAILSVMNDIINCSIEIDNTVYKNPVT